LAFRLPHRLLGLAEAGLVLQAKVAHATAQLLEALAQRLLPLGEALAVLALLAVLPRLGLLILASRATLALPVLLRPRRALPVGVVAQVTLVAHHLVELVERAVHFLRELVASLVGPRGLEVLEDVAQLVEQALGVRRGALAGELLEAVEEVVEVLRRDGARIGVGRRLVGLARVLLHALGELAQEV